MLEKVQMVSTASHPRYPLLTCTTIGLSSLLSWQDLSVHLCDEEALVAWLQACSLGQNGTPCRCLEVAHAHDWVYGKHGISAAQERLHRSNDRKMQCSGTNLRSCGVIVWIPTERERDTQKVLVLDSSPLIGWILPFYSQKRVVLHCQESTSSKTSWILAWNPGEE